ncbi:MAG: FAD-dependent oxidoreductase, partial [Alphaproteobacteria bacterium]|nr:FAD-dependent oxidoreductase [Alphaproteobacteria bacterium]
GLTVLEALPGGLPGYRLCFNKRAMDTVARLPNLSLGELLSELKMGQWFRNYYLLPMGAAIWSCPAKQMLQFPASSFVRFFHNHGLLTIDNQPQWYTVDGGSQEYVKKIHNIIGAENIRVSSRVRSVVRKDNKVIVQSESGDDIYDDVIMACHADEALALLVDSDDMERDVLSPFGYSINHAILHRDPAQMPQRKRCWSSWNYLARSQGREDSAVAVTYWMNSLQGIDERYPLFVTLNPITPVKPELIFDKHVFTHPIFTRDAVIAQTHIPRIQGQRHTWFCGAYQGNGFHEDGIKSSVKMVKAMGYSIPWDEP